MEPILSLALKLFFIFLLIALIWYGRWVGLFAAMIPLSMCEMIVPVPILSFPEYRAIIYLAPTGIGVLFLRLFFHRAPNERAFESESGEVKTAGDTRLLIWLISPFLFIVLLNYLRTGVDIFLISKGINFIHFYERLITPICVICLMPLLILTKRDFNTVLLAILGGGIVLLLDGSFIFLGYSSVVTSLRGQAGELFATDNLDSSRFVRFGQFSQGAFYLFPVAMAFLRKDIYKYIIAGVLILFAVLSGGRIVTGALVLGTAVWFFLKRGGVPLGLKGALFMSAVVLISTFQAVGMFDMLNISNVNQRIVDKEFFEKGLRGRLAIYQTSFRLVLRNPIFGIGPMDQNTAKRIRKEYGPSSAEYLARTGTHGTFANILAINGFLALGLYIGFYICVLKVLLQIYVRSDDSFAQKASLMLFLYFLITACRYLAEGKAEGGNWFFYLNLGLLFALLNYCRNTHIQTDKHSD